MASKKDKIVEERAKRITQKANVLGAIYSKAYNKVLKTLDENAGTMWRRDRARSMLASLNTTFKELDEKTKAFVKKEVSDMYRHSADAAKVDLVASGVVVKDGFSKINLDALKSLSDDTTLKFANSIKTVKKDILKKIDEARKIKIRETVGVGQTLGEATPAIADEVKKVIKETGAVGLVDKSGKSWKLDTYAKMLSREMLARASRTAIATVGQEHGLDVYQISRHGAKDACRFHEGTIFSMSGDTPGMPSLEEIESSGEIFHVGCLHGYFSIVDPSKPQEKKAKETDKRLKKGDKISNYDANKNPGKNADDTLEAQEDRKSEQKNV